MKERKEERKIEGKKKEEGKKKRIKKEEEKKNVVKNKGRRKKRKKEPSEGSQGRKPLKNIGLKGRSSGSLYLVWHRARSGKIPDRFGIAIPPRNAQAKLQMYLALL